MSRPYPYDLKLLVYADLHVGDRANGRKYTDMIEAEEWITTYAEALKVDWVVFAGDAFKSRNPHDEHKTAWMLARARRLATFGEEIRTLDVVGNHCRWYKAEESGHVFESLSLLESVEHRHMVVDKCGTVSTDDRVLFHCLPAQTEYAEGVWTTDPEVINICVFHGMVKGCSLNQEGTVKSDHGVPLEVFDRPDFDFVIMGDIHLPQMMEFKHTQGGYVGSTLQLDATDVGEKRGLLILTFVKGATEPQIEFVPVPQAELKILAWDAASPLPDLEPYRGHLVTMKVTNASALSSIELNEKISEVRGIVRHLSTSVESSDPGRAQGEESLVVYADPNDDFAAYLKQIPNLDPGRESRVLEILRNEVPSVESKTAPL